MDIRHQKVTLEVNEFKSFKTVVAKQGDNETRIVDITLTDDGEEINLAGCSAIAKVSLNGEYKAMNSCEIDYEKNLVYFPLGDNILDTPGMLNCEITLYENEKIISSGMFNIKVGKSVIPDDSELAGTLEYGVLTQLIKDVANTKDNATAVYNQLNNMTDRFDAKEDIANKMNSITFPSNNYYPTNGAVWNYVAEKLAEPKQDIESLQNNLASTVSNLASTASDLSNLTQDYRTTKNTVQENGENISGLSQRLTDTNTNLSEEIQILESKKSGLAASKNIFDFKGWINKLQGYSKPIDGGTLDSVIEDSFTFTRNEGYGMTNGWTANSPNKVMVKPNTTYTLSWENSGANANIGVYLNAKTSTTDGDAFYTDLSTKAVTFTTKNDTTFITIRFGIREINSTVTIGKIMLEEKSEKTFYLPHKVAVGVAEMDANKSNLVESKNIFDFSAWIKFIQSLSTPIDGGILANVSTDGFTFSRNEGNGLTSGWIGANPNKVSVKPNTTYTISWEYTGSGGVAVFLNGTETSGTAFYSQLTANSMTFTTNADTEFITIRFGINEVGQSVTVRKIQLEKGSGKTFYLPHLVAVGVNEIVNSLANS